MRLNSKEEMSIYLVDYDENWPARFLAEKKLILSLPGIRILGVEHIGSTAIPGMSAKPIIDIMVLIENIQNAPATYDLFAGLNYSYFPYAEDRFPMRKWFCKPGLQHRTHHLHLVQAGTDYHQDHLLFRDYLGQHSEEASAYLDLKKHLASCFPNDREAYTEGKTDFILSILKTARDGLNQAT
jgi:GrpB-like predicted nucleotidyltransferase (UPF0157 family)